MNALALPDNLLTYQDQLEKGLIHWLMHMRAEYVGERVALYDENPLKPPPDSKSVFYYLTNELLYGACMNLVRQNRTPAPDTLYEHIMQAPPDSPIVELRLDAEKLKHTLTVSAEGWDMYYMGYSRVEDILEALTLEAQRRHALRGLGGAHQLVVTAGLLDTPPVPDAIEMAQQMAHTLTNPAWQTDDAEGVTSLADALAEWRAERKRRLNPTVTLYRPSIKAIRDEITSWEADNLIVVAGRSGHGKTQWMIQEALFMAAKAARFHEENPTAKQPMVLIYSCEMGKPELVNRMIAHLARVDSRKVRDSELSSEEWDRVFTAESTFEYTLHHHMVIVSSRGWTAHKIRLHARRLARRYNFEIIGIFVDYFTLLALPDRDVNGKKIDNARLGYATNIEELKTLSGKNPNEGLNTSVFVLAQVSREVDDRKIKLPTTGDLSETMQTETAADIIILLAHLWQYDRGNMAIRNQLHMQIGKNRGAGATEWFITNYDQTTGIIATITGEEAEVS